MSEKDKGKVGSANTPKRNPEEDILNELKEMESLSARLRDFNPDMDYNGAVISYINQLESKRETLSSKSIYARNQVSKNFGEYQTKTQADDIINTINEKIKYEIENSPAYLKFISYIEDVKSTNEPTKSEESIILIAREYDLLKERELGAIQRKLNEIPINPEDKTDRKKLSFLEKVLKTNSFDANGDGVIDYEDRLIIEHERNKILNRNSGLRNEYLRGKIK